MEQLHPTYINLETLKNEQVSFFLSNKNFCSNTYNYLNLPILIDFDNGNEIHYTYTATGTKLRKEVYNENELVSSRYYLGAFEYDQDGLEFIHTGEGRIVPTETSYRYEYFLKDHLGNVRVVFTDKDDDGVADLLSEDSYYPFGMTMGGLSFSSDNIATNLYKFTGKENQDEHGLAMIDFGWRQYDNRLGRWFVVDKLAEFYHSHSPYAYVTNNPVNFIDPNGLYKIPLDGNSNGSRGPTSFRVYPKGYARGPSGWSRGADIHIPESNSNYFYYNCNNYSTWQSSYDNFVAQMGGPTFYDLYTEINGHWISNKKLKEMIVLTSTNKKIKKIIADLFNSIYGQTKYDNSLTAGPGGQNGGDSMNPKGTTKGFTSNKFELLDPNTGGVLPQSGRWDIVYFENTVAIVNGGVYDDINRTLTIYREIFEMSKTAGNYMMENAVFDVNKMYFKYYYSDPYGGMQYSYGYYYRENGIDNGVKWNGISY